MPFLMILAAAYLLFQTGLLGIEARLQVVPPVVATASDELDHYRVFLYLSSLYMKSHLETLAPGEAPLVLRAQDLWTSLGSPTGLSVNAFPSSWRLVLTSGSKWVSCTPLSEEAMGMLSQLVADPLAKPHGSSVSVGGIPRWVVAQDQISPDGCS